MAIRTGAVRKFEFERSFDSATVRRLEIVPASQPPAPPPPTFSLEDLEAARALAFAEGRDAGIVEASASIECQMAEAMARVAHAIEQARDEHRQLLHAVHRQAAETMLGLVETMLPTLARREAMAEIEALIDEALKEGFGQPRLLIRCSEPCRERIEEVARAAAARAGYPGTLVVQAGADFANEDCRIEWSNGGVERKTSQALESITNAMRDALAAPIGELVS
jgi:flagellar assembly protein FliH